MKTMILISMMAAAFVLISGCGKSGEKTGAARTEDAAGKSHAPAEVVPGSYEDWCEEHGVAESACSRCNPSLVAAFKATNDWCGEHGLPESQCLQCNPDLKIVRPAKGMRHAENDRRGRLPDCALERLHVKDESRARERPAGRRD